MTVRITRAVTLRAPSITIGDLARFIEAAKEVGADADTRVSIERTHGDQRDPGYVTLVADAGRSA